MKKVIVIGGGISGLCSAYYLVKEGCQVTVIDKGSLTTGASFINAGYLTPSHIIPLASPGMITKGLKWMFNSASPFYIKPRWDTEFFRWALYFRGASTAMKVEKAIPVIKDINLKSRDLYEQMLSSLDFDFHYEKKGVLMAYTTQKGAEAEKKMADRALVEGLEARYLSGDEARKLQPLFSEKIIGAVHYECDAHATPNQFMKNMTQWLREQGVSFELGVAVDDFVVSGRKINGVDVGGKILEADEIVLAAGSWTSRLAKSLKLNIPIQGGKGYSIDVRRTTGITLPAILVETKVAVTPMKDFTRFAGTMEFSGNNDYIRKERVEALARAVKNYYSGVEISEEEKNNALSGLRPVSPDGLPFIGKTSKYDNLTVAAGHAMMGWSLGPITGKLVTQIIMGQKPIVNLEPLAPERFA